MKKFFIVAVACLLAVAFTAPVMAEVKVGGIVFTDIMWDRRSDDFMQTTTGGVNQDSVTMVRMHETLASRVYFKWANDDGVGMHIELGLGGTVEGLGGQSGPEGVYLRHAYGWWKKSDGFRLLVGMTTSVFSPLNSAQLMGFALVGDGTFGVAGWRAHAINVGYGNIYVERCPQIRGEWYFGANFLKIALADWLNDGWNRVPAGRPAAAGEVVIEDTKIPRLDVGMKFMLGSWALYPGFTYIERTYEGTAPGVEDDFTVWAASLGLKGGAGPVTLTLEGNYAQNGSAGGLFGGTTSRATGFGAANPRYNAVTGNIYDTDTWCGFINVAFKVAHATVNLMYGIARTDQDNGPGVGDVTFTSEQYGISVPIPIAKGFIVRPEVFYIDENDMEISGAPDVDLGTQWIYGINFQIVF
jgi:hypothetical protein